MIEKPWGHEEIVITTETYIIKRLTIRPGHRLSLQKHLFKTETLIVRFGKVKFFYDGITTEESEGAIIDIPAGMVHRVENIDDWEQAVILEVSTLELDDVIRIEDDYGRCDARLSVGTGS